MTRGDGMEGFKILTSDMLAEEQDARKMLVDNVYWHFIGIASDDEQELLSSMVDCESPIEQLLAMELSKVVLQADIPELCEVAEIESNKIIIVGDKKYRVDFAIPVKYWDCYKTYIVECDGHEFHQKTKAQVERDNSRMRDLQTAGYTVIRFSGTEIFHKAVKCAWDVRKIIQAPALKFIERMLKDGT